MRTVSILALVMVMSADVALASDRPRPLVETICPLMEREARAAGISPMLFVRLIWRESAFRPNTVSHKGAQGIAQFMPATAKERGLANPYDPAEAIPHSARFLAELQREFGNFGLAAAAYNGGPERVRGWLAGQRALPSETRAYVKFITGHAADKWKDARGAVPAHSEAPSEELQTSCMKRAPGLVQIALTERPVEPQARRRGARQPWGVQLGVGTSEDRAASLFGSLKRQHAKLLADAEPMYVPARMAGRGRMSIALRVGAETRDEALKLCERLRANGGVCTVQKN